MLRNALLVAAALLLPALVPAQVKILRHPTYSKGKVAFSYLGDIWIANENGSNAQRLTDNQAREIYPRFSPDGQWIAFSSNREGNYDVYVVPAAGGKPRQLTFHTADDNVVGWTPDGGKVLFSSVRGNGAFPTVATLWEVPLEGGIEQPVPTDWGAYASYSPDGRKLAFMRHPSVWSRKHYRGAYAADLWVLDISTHDVHQNRGQDDYKGNWLWPMYGQRRHLLRLRPHRARKGHPVRRSGGDEERQQHLEDLRKGRQARAGDAPRRRQSLLPQHLGRRQGDRLRRQLRPVEARHRHRQEQRNPHRYQVRQQGERQPSWSPSTRPKHSTFRPPTGARPSSRTARSSPSPPARASRSA